MSSDDEMMEDYSEEEEEADAFDNSQQPKTTDLQFKSHSVADILEFQASEVQHVSGILGCNKEHAATLLRHHHWDKESLIEKYVENPTKILDAAGVIIDSNKRPKLVRKSGFVCDICCDDDAGLQSLALSCNHRFCKECYTSYLVLKITHDGKLVLMTRREQTDPVPDE